MAISVLRQPTQRDAKMHVIHNRRTLELFDYSGLIIEESRGWKDANLGVNISWVRMANLGLVSSADFSMYWGKGVKLK